MEQAPAEASDSSCLCRAWLRYTTFPFVHRNERGFEHARQLRLADVLSSTNFQENRGDVIHDNESASENVLGDGFFDQNDFPQKTAEPAAKACAVMSK